MGGKIARATDVVNSSQHIRCWLTLLHTFARFYSLVEAALPHSLRGCSGFHFQILCDI